jgi:hypothetical protein
MRITTSLLVTLMALTWPAAQARAENLDLLMS